MYVYIYIYIYIYINVQASFAMLDLNVRRPVLAQRLFEV